MKGYSKNYRVLVSIWQEGETLAENFKFKSELMDDQEELNQGIKNFVNDTIDSIEEIEVEDDRKTNVT